MNTELLRNFCNFMLVYPEAFNQMVEILKRQEVKEIKCVYAPLVGGIHVETEDKEYWFDEGTGNMVTVIEK